MQEITLNLIFLCTGITYILYRMYVILNTKIPEINSESNSESNSETDYYLEDFITEENTRKRKRNLI